jgi:hypothetical protein
MSRNSGNTGVAVNGDSSALYRTAVRSFRGRVWIQQESCTEDGVFVPYASVNICGEQLLKNIRDAINLALEEE